MYHGNMKGFLKIIVLLLLFPFQQACRKAEIPLYKTNANNYYIDQGDFRLHFITKGNPNNQALLLIHGAPGNISVYKNMLSDKAIQENFHVIVVDRLGYGLSRKGRSKTCYDIQRQADSIVEALKFNYSNKKAIVVGRSYGTPIAAKIAAEYPEKVAKLVLVSPTIDPEKEKYFWYAYVARHWFVNIFLNDELKMATEEKFAHESELRKMEKDWAKITAEVTVFTGGHDKIADIKNMDFAKKKLNKGKAKFVFLPKAGHGIIESHPDLVKKEFFISEI